MKLSKLLSTSFLALCLFAPALACDGGDDEGGDENADSADTNADADTTDDGTMNIECAVFCEAYVSQCLQAGLSTEFETNDLCLEACGAWDQAGVNCRFEQIPDACDQAGNMGSTC